jgi:hypothetical protein
VKRRTAQLFVGIFLSSLLVAPSYARGFGGGFGGGGFNRGAFDRGGFDRGGFDRSFDQGGFNRGGFDHGFEGAGMTGHPNSNQFTGHNPSQLASDGGFGSVAGHDTTINNYHSTDVSGGYHQNYSSSGYHPNYSSSGYHPNYSSSGYHPNYSSSGYHPYGSSYGYHPYGGAYGYHPYGAYGYHGIYGYPGGWSSAGFMEASMWTCMGLTSLTSFLGIAAMSQKQSTPAVTNQGTNVYVNGQPSQQYYEQGQQLAATANLNAATAQQLASTANLNAATARQLSDQNIQGFPQQVASASIGDQQLSTMPSSSPEAAEKWQPLGVYSLVEPGQTQSTTLFQLAINKQGIVRGNYVNQITSEKAQIHGALDKSTQQISWTIGENPSTVFSTNLGELTKDDSQVVVQFGPDNTKQMGLVRQAAPQNGDSTNPNQTS